MRRSDGPQSGSQVSSGPRPRHPGRKAQRRPARRVAWVRTDDKTPPIRCVILDYSEDGARLSFETPQVLLRFTLLSAEDATTGRPCRIRWRHSNEIGVKFV